MTVFVMTAQFKRWPVSRRKMKDMFIISTKIPLSLLRDKEFYGFINYKESEEVYLLIFRFFSLL